MRCVLVNSMDGFRRIGVISRTVPIGGRERLDDVVSKDLPQLCGETARTLLYAIGAIIPNYVEIAPRFSVVHTSR